MIYCYISMACENAPVCDGCHFAGGAGDYGENASDVIGSSLGPQPPPNDPVSLKG
jgi:hypothetical protein